MTLSPLWYEATGARRASKTTSSKRSEFAEADASERADAFHEFVKECPTGNFVDFLDEVYGGDNPHFLVDGSVSTIGGTNQCAKDDDDDDVQEQDDSSACKRVRVDTASDVGRSVNIVVHLPQLQVRRPPVRLHHRCCASTSSSTSTSVAVQPHSGILSVHGKDS